MKDSFIPSTLRQMRAFLFQRSVLVALLGAGLLLGISGPFATGEVIPNIVLRSAYWLFIVFATFASGSFVSALVRRALPGAGEWLLIALNMLAIGVVVTLVVSLINASILGTGLSLARLLETLLPVTLIAGVVEAGISIASRSKAPPEPSAAQPAILDRLPFDKRGPLVALSVSDHYVNVTTTKGSELLLLRLSDAIRETEPTRGLHCHRSHWAALGQVTAARREGDRAILTMSAGQEIPVSRANVAAVKAAGLLP